MNSVTVVESLEAVNGYFLHFLAGVILVLVFSAVYIRMTPYPEFKLIREGNVAPAVSFSGALLGFVISLASAISQSVSFLDMMVWALVALVVQVLVFLALRFFFTDLSRSIAANNIAPAILLGVLSLAAGILNAACMID
jgi:putative membrane protein